MKREEDRFFFLLFLINFHLHLFSLSNEDETGKEERKTNRPAIRWQPTGMLNWWNRMPVVTLCSGRAFSVLSLFDGDPARMSFSLFLVFMFWPDQSKRKNRDPVVHYFPFFCHADGGRNNVNKEKPAVCWWQKERKGRQDHGRISFFLLVFFAGIIKKGEEKERNDARMKKTIRKKERWPAGGWR